METAKKPMTMAELLPGLSGIISKDAMQTFTAKKQPRPLIMQTRTTEKVFKPLTIAEMRADIQALKIKSPRTCAQSAPSSKKKNWNSSIKVDKRISHTANGNMKNNPVRKALTFQSKDKVLNPKITINPPNLKTQKFPKPAVKNLIHLQARNTVRISGICHIQETPVLGNKSTKKRLTLANKENVLHNPPLKNEKKSSVVPLQILHKKISSKQIIPDTPLSNESWKSGSDASFLQREKEINDVEEKAAALANELTLENIADVSPPISTPFKEYRNVHEYFNNSSELETSALYNDNTIMCFDKPYVCKKENNREESVIVSLCDLFNKAKVTTQNASTELEDLLEVQQQTQHNIKMIDNAIQTLKNIKESQVKSLHYVQKLISEKNNHQKDSDSDMDKTLVTTEEPCKSIKVESGILAKSPILGKSCSVIKSPTYKIPKKSLCLRKKVFHKSMPDVLTPDKEFDGRALNMYMKMKKQMNFLNTPVVKQHNIEPLDTPAVTSHNLQRQLDRLYDES